MAISPPSYLDMAEALDLFHRVRSKRRATLDTFLQVCADTAGPDTQGIHAQAKTRRQVLSMVDFRLLVVLVVRQYQFPVRIRKGRDALLETIAEPLLVLIWRRRFRHPHAGQFGLLQGFTKDVAGHAGEIIGGISGVICPDFRQLARHAIHGSVGEFFGDCRSPAHENLDQALADPFVAGSSFVAVGIEPGQKLLELILADLVWIRTVGRVQRSDSPRGLTRRNLNWSGIIVFQPRKT